MDTPLLFFSNSREECWRRVLQKLSTLYQIKLNLNHNVEQFIKNDLVELPQSVLVINCENKNIAKQGFVNIIREFSALSFDTTKVCIINQMELASIYVQNAILKNLESREKTLYLITTTSLRRILPTVLSRVIVLEHSSFKSYEEDLINMANNYSIKLTKEEIREYSNKMKTRKLGFFILKLNDVDIIKALFVWQQLMINEVATSKTTITEELAQKLKACDKAFNLNAIGYYSKSVLLSEVLDGFIDE